MLRKIGTLCICAYIYIRICVICTCYAGEIAVGGFGERKVERAWLIFSFCELRAVWRAYPPRSEYEDRFNDGGELSLYISPLIPDAIPARLWNGSREMHCSVTLRSFNLERKWAATCFCTLQLLELNEQCLFLLFSFFYAHDIHIIATYFKCVTFTCIRYAAECCALYNRCCVKKMFVLHFY